MTATRQPVPKCYLVIAYAPEGVSAARANDAFNSYIEDHARGLVLSHDHFIDRPGGYAVFACETREQVNRLSQGEELAGWSIAAHPLTFSDNALRWIYQVDFTLGVYRDVRLQDQMACYLDSREYGRLNEQLSERRSSSAQG